MRKLLGWILLLILCGCGGGGGGQNSGGSGGSTPAQMTQLSEVSLVRVELVAASPLASGLSTDLQLFAVFSNGIRVDVTGQASFTSASPAVSLSGSRATAVSVGSSTITGQFQGQSASSQVQVIAATLTSLRIDPPQASLAAGLTQQFRAVGTFSDNSTSELTTSVSWSVETPARAEFQTSPKGLLKALTAGDTHVVATLQGKTAQADLHVTSAVLQSLEVSPNPASLPIGIGQQFTATGVFSDGSHRNITEDVAWSSSDTDTFLVSDAAGSKGIGAGLKLGTADVSAASGAISGSTRVTVVPGILQSLTLTPVDGSVANGLDLAFQAIGRFSDGQNRDLTDQVIWSSQDPGLATISNLPGSSGLAHGKSEGQTTITAQLNGVSQNTGLTVSAAVLQSIDVGGVTASLPAGLTRALTASGRLSDGSTTDLTNQVVWSSSAEEVAVIDQGGLVTAKKSGNTSIKASKGAIEGKATLVVSQAVLQSLSLTPLNSQLPQGLTRQFSASGHYSDGSSQDLSAQVTWTSSDPLTASISNASPGLARALKLGNTVIKAEFNGLEEHTNLEVTAAVVTRVLVSPAKLTIPVGLSNRLRATAVLSDGSQQDVSGQVSWSSADSSVINLDSGGRALALKEGDSTLRASLGSLQGELPAQVQGAVTSIQVVTGSTQVTNKSKVRYYALAELSDGTRRDASADVVWSVQSGATDMTIAQGYERGGELTVPSLSATAQIKANLGALEDKLSATSAVVSEGFTPRRQLNLPRDGRANLHLYTTSLSEYTGAGWTSSNTSVATVNSSGLVTVQGPGNATITGGEVGNPPPMLRSVKLHVPSSPFQRLELKTASGGVPVGGQGAARAEAVTADGERVDVSEQAVWSSSNPDNALVFGGRIEARQAGSTILTASYGNLSASSPVTITSSPATVGSVRFVDSSLPAGGDGSQSSPFNNLAEAMSNPGPLVFLFQGDGSGDGMQWSKPLPAGFELRGQRAGFDNLGIAASADYPHLALKVNPASNSWLHGFAAVQLGVMDFARAGNVTLEDLALSASAVTIGDSDGPCRILNNQLYYSQGNSSALLFSLLLDNSSKTDPRVYEFGNNTVVSDNQLNAFLGFPLAQRATALSELHLDVHDNTDSFVTSPGVPILASLNLRAQVLDLKLTNNSGGDCFALISCKQGSTVQIAGNSLKTLNFTADSSAGDIAVVNNRVAAISYEDSGTTASHTSLRMDGNQISGVGTFATNTLQVVTAAAPLLVQSNQLAAGNLTISTATLASTRLTGLRDNRVLAGELRLDTSAPGCIAVTGNLANRFQLSGSSTLVVEGLSMLSSLNSFGSISTGSFVEAPVDSCGIPR